MDPTLLLNIFEPENAMNHPDHDPMQFRRPKRGNKVHAIEAGPVHDGERYSAAVCGYRPTGRNHNCFGWMDDRNGWPCLMCEGALVAAGRLDEASNLTGRLYDDDPARAPTLTGQALHVAAASAISERLTEWYRASYHDPESTITVDPSTFERRGKGWEAKAAHEREAWTDRETVIADVHVGSDLPDIVEYGVLPAMTLGPKDGFRVIAWRPSGSPRCRDPRLSRS